MIGKWIFYTIVFLVIAIPASSILGWLLIPEKKVGVVIYDQTVLKKYGQEHRSFNWILSHFRYTKKNGSGYNVSKDYYGFFPLEKDYKYVIKDFSRFSQAKMDSLIADNDICYFTDAYGIYSDEWYAKTEQTEHSPKIYGGLNSNDSYILKNFSQQKKLVFMEFNNLASPTPRGISRDLQAYYGINWTGWTGRYFDTLDTLVNPEIPKWMLRMYRNEYRQRWDYHHQGIVFIHEDNRIVVLEYGKYLKDEIPVIKTKLVFQEKYKLPEEVIYPFWIDVTLNVSPSNRLVSQYHINPTPLGDSLMKKNGIPKIIPAVIKCDTIPYFYFCGDFADNPIRSNMSKFLWIEKWYGTFIYSPVAFTNRERFFWKYYVPLMKNILQDYYDELDIKRKITAKKAA